MIRFSYLEKIYLASAEAEKIDKNIWHFNRLFVHEKLRYRGIGTALVKAVVKFFNENKLTLINHVNSYGDLELKQLKQFYLKNGFLESPIENLVVLLKEDYSINDLMANLSEDTQAKR